MLCFLSPKSQVPSLGYQILFFIFIFLFFISFLPLRIKFPLQIAERATVSDTFHSGRQLSRTAAVKIIYFFFVFFFSRPRFSFDFFFFFYFFSLLSSFRFSSSHRAHSSQTLNFLFFRVSCVKCSYIAVIAPQAPPKDRPSFFFTWILFHPVALFRLSRSTSTHPSLRCLSQRSNLDNPTPFS